MEIFCRKKGTISVFLTIILLPVLLLGGMTTDASRIFMAKVVISDAGEMTMNAALAQYNEDLHDEYGLLVMDRPPEAMKSELEQYFNGSLNGTGMPGEGDYDRILDLLTKKFDAVNVVGSEIYQTEVEKQQILEYMKYRAPVCLTELVVDKLKQLKDTKKMAEAMKKQMKFGEAMEDCHNEFQRAKVALDMLDGVINSLNSQTIEKELSNTKDEYEVIVSKALLMWAATQIYDDRLSDSLPGNMKASAEVFLGVAKDVNLSSPYTDLSFNAYISSMYYMNSINDLGGISKLLEKNTPAQEGEEEDNSAELEALADAYKREAERIEVYPDRLLWYAGTCIEEDHKKLKGYLDNAKGAEQAAKDAYGSLEKVKKELEKAKTAFSEWDKANGELKSAGQDTGSMDEEVSHYRDFFFSSDGTGNADFEQIESLMSDVRENQKYFHELTYVLEGEEFWDESIAAVSGGAQFEEYKKEALNSISVLNKKDCGILTNLENVRKKNYITHYKHMDISEAGSSIVITNHPFYKRLREYCKESNKQDSQQEQNEANNRLEQSSQAGQEAGRADEYPNFNWSEAGVTLPSSVAGGGASEAKDQLTDLNAKGDVNNSSARKETTKKFTESIDAATTFLGKVDEIVTKGLENLYISEYAMQMFSYYTVNKKDGQERPEGDIISISGYSLSRHAAYQAECEYILWGKNESQTNIRNTVMMIFGIRLLFNSFFAFTDKAIGNSASAMATAIAGGWAPYLAPVIKVVIKLGFAGVETAEDITKLKQGYGVVIVKKKDSWATFPHNGNNTDSKRGLTFDYSDYLRVFLNLSMLGGEGEGILGRVADCIQVNQPDMNLLEGYTMLSVQAKVSSRTTFMRKIADWGEGVTWGFPDDTYTISYQSILGY